MGERMRSAFRNGTRVLRGVSISSLIPWAGGYILGALTNIFPVQSVIVFGGVCLLLIVMYLCDTFRSSQITEFTKWELGLRVPDKNAVDAVSRSNEHYLVVGQAIETVPHPQLNSRASLECLGWDPADVTLVDQQTRFDADVLIRLGCKVEDREQDNGAKFCLVDSSYVTTDGAERKLSLYTQRTDYLTHMSVLPHIKNNPTVRAEFGSLDPAVNRIPHSLCLHYMVRFSNGDVLCMRRARGTDFHANRWSFSGEEQLSGKDFDTATPCLSFFRRTFCEEVLGLREDTPLDERWCAALEYVEAMRLWSVFVEEEIHNFTLLGLFQLKCDPEEFRKIHESLVNAGKGTKDNEGKFHVVRHPEFLKLLVAGECNATPFFGKDQMDVKVKSGDLHPTSRYRLFRLLRAVRRAPLDQDYYDTIVTG